jgi:hypothetical protein
MVPYCTFSFLNPNSFDFILSIFGVFVDSTFMITVHTLADSFGQNQS